MRTSKSMRAFYPDGVAYPNLPNDLVTISQSLWESLIAGQTAGQVIEWGNDGVPYLADRPAQPLSEWRATAKVSRFQAREQLRRDGLLTAATAIAQGAGGTAWEAWQSAIEFRRMSDTINGLAPQLRPDLQGEALEEWKDQFFRDAGKIEA